MSENNQELVFLNILRGITDSMPETSSKIVSIFLSSTFTDMKNERDILIKNAYPELKNYCKEKYNLEFQIIDMRWGIEGFSTKVNLGGQFCLDEVHQCNRISAKPCFIALVSNKRGASYLPAAIEKSTFDLLKDNIRSKDLKFKMDNFEVDNLISHCYQLDENVDPNVYRLKDLEAIVINRFNSKDKSSINSESVKSFWIEIESKLLSLFQHSAQICYDKKLINEKAKNEFFLTITEKEIYEGILNNQVGNVCDQTLVFVRRMADPPDLNEIINSENGENKIAALSRYYEIEVDKTNKTANLNLNANKQLEELKNELRSFYSKHPNNLIEFQHSVEFKFNEFEIKNKRIINESKFIEHNIEYFNEFEKQFKMRVKELIDRSQMRKTRRFDKLSEDDNQLINELLIHFNYCKKLNERFMGRSGLLEKITRYIKSPNRIPLIIYGQSGCGKSSLIAKVASTILDQLKPKKNYLVVFRFLGNSPMSGSISMTFCSIIKQIVRLFNLSKNTDNLEELSSIQLRDFLIDVLNTINEEEPEKKLIIMLDSIDQLVKRDYDLDWIPLNYPPNTKFVYSFITKFLSDKSIQDEFNKLYPMETFSESYVEANELEQNEALNVLDKLLEKENRKLKQYETIKGLIQKGDKFPMYIKIIFNMATKWPSYYLPEPKRLKDLLSTNECIKYIFEMLENDYGKLLVERCLFHLTLSGDSGISDVELADALSLDQELLDHIYEFHLPPDPTFPIALWNRVKLYLNEYLAFKEIDGVQVYSWYHRRFYETASVKYVYNMSLGQKDKLNINMLNVFIEKYRYKPKKMHLKIIKKLTQDDNSKMNCQIYTSPQPFDINKSLVNHRRLNRTLKIISSLSNDAIPKYIIEEVFLNYKFISRIFHNYFHIWDFSRSQLLVSDLLLLIQKKNDDNDVKTQTNIYMGFLAILIQFIYISIADKLNKYPKSLATQILSKLLSLNGSSSHVTRFVEECDRESLRQCALIATYQSQQFLNARIRQLGGLFNHVKMIQNAPGGQYYILGGRNIVYWFYWSQFNQSPAPKRINLPDIQQKEFCFIKVFEELSSQQKNNLIAATKTDVIICDLNKNTHSSIINSSSSQSANKKQIKDLFLIGSHTLIVLFENVKYLALYSLGDIKECYECIRFESEVKFCVSNKQSQFCWIAPDYTHPFFLAVALTNGTFHILQSLYGEAEFKSKVILEKSFRYVYSNRFDGQVVSACFQTWLFSSLKSSFRSKTLFKMFLTTNGNRCFHLEVDSKENIQIESIELLKASSKLTVVNYTDKNFAILQDSERQQIYIYNTKLKRCLTIPGLYERVMLNYEDNGEYGLVYAFSQNSISVFIIKLNEFTYNVIHLIENLSFSNTIFYTSFSQAFFTAIVFLSDGNILDVDLSSVIFGYAQDNLYDKVDYDIKNMRILPDNMLLTWADNRQCCTINKWNYLNGRLVGTFDLENKFLDIFLCKSHLLVARENSNDINTFYIDIYKTKDSKIKKVQEFLLKSSYENCKCYREYEGEFHLALLVSSVQLKFVVLKRVEKKWTIDETEIKLDRNITDSKSINACFTQKDSYLVVSIDNEIFYIDLKEPNKQSIKILCHDPISKFIPINLTNDLIIRTNREKDDSQLAFIDFNNQMKVNLDKKLIPVGIIHEIRVYDRILAIHSKEPTCDILVLFELNNTLENGYKVIFKDQYPHNDLKMFTVSNTNGRTYLIVHQICNNLLTVHRIEPQSQIACVPLFRPVNHLIASEKFIVMSIEKQRIISYLIADPLDDHEYNMSLIKSLPSRNINSNESSQIKTDRILNALFQIYVNRQTLSWKSIFTETKDTETDKEIADRIKIRSKIALKQNRKNEIKNEILSEDGVNLTEEESNLLAQFDFEEIYAKQSNSCIEKLKSKIRIYDFEDVKVKQFDLPSILDENGVPIQNDHSIMK